MRKLGFVAASLLFLAPAASHAKTLEELLVEKGVITRSEATAASTSGASKVYWNKGTTIESDNGMTSKVRVGLQPRFTYTDNNRKNSSEKNSSSFDVNLARLVLEGSAMDGEFEYQIEGDWAKSGIDAENATKVSNAYFQWNNCDWSSIRFGQFKTTTGRQYNSSDFNGQFADRSIASRAFNFGRQQGLAGMADLMDGRLKLGAGIFNGLSTGEGENLAGVDTNMAGTVNASYTILGKMDRNSEGDVNHTENVAWDIGAAYGVSNDKYDATSTTAATEWKAHLVTVDTAVKAQGFSLQGEYFWQNLDSSTANDEVSDNGAYVQAGYFIQPKKWEIAARWGLVSCDENSLYSLCQGLDDYNEATAAINYYMMGHALKAGFNYSIIDADPVSGESFKNNRWLFQVSSMF